MDGLARGEVVSCLRPPAPPPIDGWPTVLWRTDRGYRIQAGCHTFTLDEAKAHYANRDDRTGLYYLATEAWQVIAKLHGWED